MKFERIRAAIITFALFVSVGSARALPLTQGDILVSWLSNSQVREYTLTGTLVQTFNIPPSEGPRDIVVDQNSIVQIYNGTFDPVLSSLDPVTGAISNRTYPGWSTVNNVSYGGIGVLGSFVYVTDMATFGNSEDPAEGIIRFDLSAGTAVRFADTREYTDLTIGGDGLLYGLPGPNSIDVFDPISLTFVRSIDLSSLSGADVRGIAVGLDGTVYAAAWNGFVYALTAQGVILNSRNTGIQNLNDIDLDSLGRLLIGSRFGDVILTDATLATQSSFNIDNTNFGDKNIHVAWVVPEPSVTMLVTMTFCLSSVAIWRKRRSADVRRQN
jgi:hypothetical protein